MSPEVSSRPTIAIVDLEAVRENIRLVRRRVGENRRIMAVVKSDGYGHGMLPVARAARQTGAQVIGVATADEAFCLRALPEFAEFPMMVVGPTLGSEARAIQEANLSVSVGENSLLRDHLREAKRLNKPAKIHIQTDTGITRDGYRFDKNAYLEEVAGNEAHIEGLWTHFAVSDSLSDEDMAFTDLQCDRFDGVVEVCRKAGLNLTVHAANSGAVLRHPRAHYDMVRPGLMIYGMEPSGDETQTPELRQALTLKSRLAVVKEVEPGDTISYGRLYRVPNRRRIGIIPAGYGDGYMVAFSTKGSVLVRGKRAPIRGRVCMDQFMVDLDEIPEAQIGDEVVIYGSQGSERICIEEAARVAGTIPYELTCSLTMRVPRILTG